MTEKILIKYHNPNAVKLEKISKGDWIDLRATKGYSIKKGDFVMIDLGVSMKLPDGYEAHVAPRSSTFKKWGLIQTNSIGVIDNSYSGTNDVWMMPVLATRDTKVYEGDRICQFRIMKSQPEIEFEEVDSLDKRNRGGFGSTGTQIMLL